MSTSPAVIANFTPQIVDSWLTEPYQGYAGAVRYHDRSWAGIRAIVVHIQEGSNVGTKMHFRVVRASSTVLISKGGVIERLVPENKAPWTNGDVASPDQVAIALMNRYGWDPNTWCLTIENEGYSGGLPYTEAQFKANVWQIWDWLVRYPTIETIHILRHGQINSVTRPNCPEPSPYRFMARVLDALLDKVPSLPQPESPTEVYRPAWPVRDDAGKLWDGAKDLVTTNAKGVQTHWHADKRTVTVIVDALNCRQWASSTANLTRTALPRGTTVSVLGWVEGEEVEGERRWWVTTYGTRLWVGGTAEEPREAAPLPERPDDNVSQPDYGPDRDPVPVVLNGNTYFPLEQHGDKPGQVVRFKENTNIRLWAATHEWSPVLRVAPKGSTARVTHRVKGEPVDIPGLTTEDNRDRWLVIAEGADPIRTGGRVWAGLVEEA